MMKMENRTVGQLNLFLVGLAFAYYTAWIIGLPFVDEDYLPLVKPFFPLGPEWGLGVPCVLMTIICVPLFIRTYQLVKEDREAEASQASFGSS